MIDEWWIIKHITEACQRASFIWCTTIQMHDLTQQQRVCVVYLRSENLVKVIVSLNVVRLGLEVKQECHQVNMLACLLCQLKVLYCVSVFDVSNRQIIMIVVVLEMTVMMKSSMFSGLRRNVKS